MPALSETIHSGSKSFQALNAHLLGQHPPLTNKATPEQLFGAALLEKAQKYQDKIKPRIRQQKGDGMNKTERGFYEHLKRVGHTHVLCQAITLKIANGCRYCPDFITIDTEVTPGFLVRQALTAYEVKGPHAWDDSIVKLKVAANQYPWIKFHLVSRKLKTHYEWDILEVHP